MLIFSSINHYLSEVKTQKVLPLPQDISTTVLVSIYKEKTSKNDLSSPRVQNLVNQITS